MKTLKLLITTAFFAVGMMVSAQTLISEENFQSFKEQGWKNDTVCGYKKLDSKASFTVAKTYGSNKVVYSFNKCGVAPTCDAKKTPATQGVSTGFVEVNKKDGEIIMSALTYISTIEVGASATGSNRGYAVYKSVNGGAWVKVEEVSGGKQAQSGFVNTFTINESNVSLKFIPIMSENKEGELAFQSFRIHNIKVYGK